MKKKWIISTIVSALALTVLVGVSTQTKSEAKWYFGRTRIAKCEIEYDSEKKLRTGKEIKPEVSISHKGEKLVEDVDYTLQYKNNIEKGYGKIKIKGIGDYRGKASRVFYIYTICMAECDMKLKEKSFDYTGKEIKPTVEVHHKDVLLTEGVDYEYYAKNNVDAGTAEVGVRGKGSYEGTIYKKFFINGKSIEDCKIIRENNQTYVLNKDGSLLDLNYYTLPEPKVEKVKKGETSTHIIYSVYTTYYAKGKGLYYGTISAVENTEMKVEKPKPTPKPTKLPTVKPSTTPSQAPTGEPVATESPEPTEAPTESPEPTFYMEISFEF